MKKFAELGSPKLERMGLCEEPQQIHRATVIPRWETFSDTESDTQTLYIPSSGQTSIIAKAPLSKLFCCNSIFPFGEYKAEYTENSLVLEMISKEKIDEFCVGATDHCLSSMIHAKQGKYLFYLGVLLTTLICSMIIFSSIVHEVPYISFIVILIFVFGIGCCYEIINVRSRKIYDALSLYIHLNEDLSTQSVAITAGPFGAYIEFSLVNPKAKPKI